MKLTKTELAQPLRGKRAEILIQMAREDAIGEAAKKRRNGFALIKSGCNDLRRSVVFENHALCENPRAMVSYFGSGEFPLADEIGAKIEGKISEEEQLYNESFDRWQALYEQLQEVRRQLRAIYNSDKVA